MLLTACCGVCRRRLPFTDLSLVLERGDESLTVVVCNHCLAAIMVDRADAST